MNKKQFYMHKIANLLNIQKIVTIHYQALERNYVFPEETHDFWEINYADKGGVSIGVENKKIHLKQGEILIERAKKLEDKRVQDAKKVLEKDAEISARFNG